MKRILKVGLSTVLSMMFVFGAMPVVSEATTYDQSHGNIDGYKFDLTMYGNTIDLYATTYYEKNNVTCRATIVGTYVGDSFAGTKTTGGSKTTVSPTKAVAYIGLVGSNRFISAKSTHLVGTQYIYLDSEIE